MYDPGIAPVFMNVGMFCVGCPASQGETVAEAAMVHGIDADELVEELNNYLAGREGSEDTGNDNFGENA